MQSILTSELQRRKAAPASYPEALVSQRDHLSWPWPDQGRVERSSLLAVKGLFDNSLLRGGFDPDVADQLSSALSYLNRAFDDVPERLVASLEGEAVDQDWSAIPTSWVASSADVRDARLQATHDRAVHPRDIDPKNYRWIK